MYNEIYSSMVKINDIIQLFTVILIIMEMHVYLIIPYQCECYAQQ